MLRTARSSNQNGLRPGPQSQHGPGNAALQISPHQQQQQQPQQQQQQQQQQQRHAQQTSHRRDYVVMPTQFLLGGNVHDPLNLAALTNQSEANQRTPINSPLTTSQHKRQIEVLIPADLNDPLRLNHQEGHHSDSLLLCRPLTSPLKFNSRNKRNNNNNNNNSNNNQQPKRRRCDSDGAMMDVKQLDLTPRKRTRISPILNQRSGPPTPLLLSDRTPYTRLAAARAICSAELIPPTTRPDRLIGQAPASDPSFLRRRAATMSQMALPNVSSMLTKRDLFSTPHEPSAPPPPPPPPPASQPSHTVSQAPPLSCIQLPTPIFSTSASSISTATTSVSSGNAKPTATQAPKRFADAQGQSQKFNRSERRFQYGNYNRYYGYRNGANQPDTRLAHFKRDWFERADVLDIGCNVGHLTLTIARDLKPNRIVGVDIDAQLIRSARGNIRNYVTKSNVKRDSIGLSVSEENDPITLALPSKSIDSEGTGSASPERCVLTDSPRINVIEDTSNTETNVSSAAILNCSDSKSSGASSSATLDSSPVASATPFPQNVRFFAGNYVLMNDQLLDQQSAEYDTILCMSVSKWVHLNWGDDGLKRLFKRVFRQLRPGGRFILEPQPWSSYCRKKSLTVRIPFIVSLFFLNSAHNHN
jgi:2-polyprenyl-3-methyl-5-hydroxy-6-metoxy-1,4-benzoquinol methylase